MSHIALEDNLYDAKSVRELDRIAIEERGIPGIVLMKRAGRAAFDELLGAWGRPQLITVFCGSGNNGGDGYIIAGLAAQQHIPVQVIELAAPEKLKGDAVLARQFADQHAVSLKPFSECVDISEGVVVDALLGTGFTGEVREPYAQAIRLINNFSLPVLAVDIPSGLASDTGAVGNTAVNADVTVTFIGAKQGLFTGRGPASCGDIVYHSLDVPEDIFENVSPSSQLMDLASLLDCLPEREADAYKTNFGHVLVIGGDYGLGGAVMLAAEAAMRAGAGLVSVATRPEHVSALLARRPEAMVCGVESGQVLKPLLERSTVLVVGPGLGKSAWSEQLLKEAVSADVPIVLDADALNLLAEGRVIRKPDSHKWVITPHPGEAARLLKTTVENVQEDRFCAVRKLEKATGAVSLLKGAGTLIVTVPGQPVSVCPYGNPGMATGGMGDVLSGLIGGLLAQGLSRENATQLACCLHASAADLAAEELGQQGLLATEILPFVRKLLNRDFL